MCVYFFFILVCNTTECSLGNIFSLYFQWKKERICDSLYMDNICHYLLYIPCLYVCMCISVLLFHNIHYFSISIKQKQTPLESMLLWQVTSVCGVGKAPLTHVVVGVDLGADRRPRGLVALLSLRSSRVTRAFHFEHKVSGEW